MNKYLPIAAAVSIAAATSASALTITETFSDATQTGYYTVSVAYDDPGSLVGIGVSNPFSTAHIFPSLLENGCDGSGTYLFGQICYAAQTLDARNWGSSIIDYFGESFEEVFGAFEDHVEDGETTINWYSAYDGEMQLGDVSSSNYFGFSSYTAASTGLAVFSNGGTQTGILVNAPAPVPLPATGLLLAGALGGIGLLRRRKKS